MKKYIDIQKLSGRNKGVPVCEKAVKDVRLFVTRKPSKDTNRDTT